MTQYFDFLGARIVIGFYGKDYSPYFTWHRILKSIPIGFANVYIFPSPRKGVL